MSDTIQYPIVEYEGIRVLTSSQIAEAYETDSNTLNKNFNRNKERYKNIQRRHLLSVARMGATTIVIIA